jgi:hypothetical protein
VLIALPASKRPDCPNGNQWDGDAAYISSLKTKSYEDTKEIFDRLLEIQAILSEVSFKYGIPMGRKLNDLVREFERLDEPYIREYWYSRFAKGADWPNSE